MEQEQFNEVFRQITKVLSGRIIRIYAKLPKTDESRIIGKQLIVWNWDFPDFRMYRIIQSNSHVYVALDVKRFTILKAFKSKSGNHYNPTNPGSRLSLNYLT